MPSDEMTIEAALQVIADGTPRLKRFHDHYLTNTGVIRYIIAEACSKGFFQPRRTVKDLIKSIRDAVNNENDIVVSDCAAALCMLTELICPDDRNDGVDPDIIPPGHIPDVEFVEALLFNFRYRAFMDERRELEAIS